MKQISENIQLQSPSHGFPFRLLPYLRFVVMLLAGFGLTSIGVMTFAQSTRPTQPSSNPFLEYAYMFPGNLLSSSHAKTFSCWGTNNYYASEVSCMFTPASDIFDSIQTDIRDGIISQTTFTLHKNTMKIGNLVLLLDAPHFHAYPHRVFFFWSNFFVIVSTTIGGKPAAMRPVWSVTFTHTY